MIKYELSDGSVVSVAPEHEQIFLIEHPGAKKIESGKTLDPAVNADPSVGSSATGSKSEGGFGDWRDIISTVSKIARSTTPGGYASVVSQEAVEGTLVGDKKSTFSTIAGIGGEYAESLYTGWETGRVLEENLQVFKGDHSPEAIEAMVRAGERLNKLPQNDRMTKFAKAVEDGGGGFWNGLIELAKDPDGGALLASQVAAQSLAMMVGGGYDSLADLVQGKTPDALAWMAAGAGTGALTFGAAGSVVPGLGNLIGAGGGAIAGTMGGLSTALENGLTFTELLKEEIESAGDEYNKDTIKKFLENEKNYLRIRNKALKRGLTIGMVDMIGGGLAGALGVKTAKSLGKTVTVAGKTLTSTTRAGTLTGLGVTTIGEGISGGVGEYVGQKAAGQEYNAADIILEAFAETPGAVVTGPTKQLLKSKPTYTITQNSKKVDYTQEEFLNKINGIDGETLAKLDIDIQNDDMLAGELFRLQDNYVLDSQIDTRVGDTKDRQELVEKAKELRKAKADAEKKGIRKVPGAKEKVQKIEAEIDAILEKYSGVDRRTKDVRARKKTQMDVSRARTETLINKINEANEKAGKKQIKTVKDLAEYIGEKTGLEINVESGNTQKFQEYLASDENRLDYQKTLQGLEAGLETIVNDPDATQDEVNAAQEELGKLRGAGQVGVAPLDEVLNVVKGESKRYGRFAPKLDEKGNVIKYDLFINEQTSFRDGMLNTAAHEFFHAAIFSTLKGNVQAQMSLGNALMRALKSKKAKLKPGSLINEQINRYTENEGLGEEILAITSENFDDIEINEGFVQGLRDVWRRFGQKYLGREIRFDTDQDVLNFVKDFHKTIKDPKKINKAVVAMIAKGAEGKLLKGIDIEGGPKTGEAFSKSPLEEIKGLIPKTVKTQEDYYALLNDPRISRDLGVERILDVKGNLAPVIQNYIRSRSTSPEMAQKNIEEVKKRLANFDPAAKRADGSVVGPEGFGEFIFANANFGRMVAAEKLFKEGEARKRTTRIDDPDVKDIADTPAQTTTTDQKQDEARTLNNFDIELEDGLVDAEIEAEIQSLIEENPDNLAERIEKLILGEIRKKLDNSVGKIAKNKETGKVEPTPEYEKFIRSEFDEIVSSLGIDVIRKSYKPWFDQTKTGTKDYKNINPETGKVSNYRKDTFINKANKPKYLKFFLQGSPNVLRERRTALLRRIARRKAEVAIDKYIESNSTDLNTVVDSKLRQMSKTAQNIQNEQTSFDSVRFSKDVPNRIKKYQNTPEFKNKTKGHILEQVIIDILKSYGLPTKYLRVAVDHATEKGSIADVSLEINGQPVRVEIKLDEKVIMGSVLVSNLKTKKVATSSMQNSIDFEGILGKTSEQINNLVSAYNRKIKIYNQKNNTNEPLMDIDNPIGHAMVESVYKELVNEEFTADIYRASQTRSLNAQPLIDHYLNKFAGAVTEIEIFGKGMYSFVENSLFGANVPYIKDMARVQTNLRVINSGGKKTMDKRTLKNDRFIRFQLQFSNTLVKGSLKDPKNPVSLTRKQDMVLNLGIPLKENLAIPFSNAVNNATTVMYSKEAKGISILDFDDTLATTESLVKYTTPDGTTGTLNAEQFASTYENLQNQGYTFDFSDFNKVVKGKLAPLFQKALKLQNKFGPENMFVLTARPPKAQKAIFDFLKANGLNIPLKNITGLGNSTAEAKALWVADKVGEGYNDFYFADDALQNVQAVDNMLEQFDVKRKVQQAKVRFSKDLDPEFNRILEEVTGIEAAKRFSDTKARKRGADKGKFRFFIPPSHEDFVGLLYNFMGKGRQGDQHRNFFEQALIRPLNRAYREIDTAKQAIANDYKELNKKFTEVKKKLVKNTPDGDFTFQDAIRVYLWDKHGYTIPGLSKTDQANLVAIVMGDPELQGYAETLNVISKQQSYVDPGPNWETGNIRIDLVDATGRVGRESYFTEFNENAEIIFSPENLNKIEAAYGKGVRDALEDMLHRIKTGVNRPKGASAKPNIFMNWLNASVAGVMFFNTRSALLQQLSNVNYLNFADNNIFAAGKAFANQPQYWKDFAMIFNSDMLKQRRGGLQTDINGAELAEAIKKARPGNYFDQVAIITGKALRLGFLPTQIGDNIAIATGGAAFYRNRVNKYIKDGLSVKDAEKAAFTDFQDITQSTQQSARPDMTSQQQASWIGKLVLNFLNTPSQYNRIIKKAGSDILNRRITKPNTTQTQSDMSNASRILYYGAAQNLIFYSLQTALFAVMFGDEDEENEQFLKKKERVINGSIDTILRGSGIYGVAVSTLKNMMIKFLEQREKGYNKDESAVIMEMLNFSPVVGIKARKIVNAEKTLNYNKNVIKEMETLDIDNPMWSAVTNYIEATTNAPFNRLYQKTINLRNAMDNQYTAFQRALFFSGYTTWSLGLGDTKKMKDIKEKVKQKKKDAAKEKRKKNKKKKIKSSVKPFKLKKLKL